MTVGDILFLEDEYWRISASEERHDNGIDVVRIKTLRAHNQFVTWSAKSRWITTKQALSAFNRAKIRKELGL